MNLLTHYYISSCDIVLTQWTLELNDDPTDPVVSQYDGKSVIWNRRARLFGIFRLTFSSISYDLVQIIDGSGNEIEPAYTAFKDTVRQRYRGRFYFDGLKPDQVNDYSCGIF